MDNQPKIRPEWVPEAYREQGDDKKQHAKQRQSFGGVNSGFKRTVRKGTGSKRV